MESKSLELQEVINKISKLEKKLIQKLSQLNDKK
jgi:hypothetical protein